MADAPRLNSATDATAAKYAPLSGLAVAAVAVAALFVLVLAVMAVQAYSVGLPLLNGLLFVLPAAGIALAFIARRQIRNSEGARTGEQYANLAWWVCVVVGSCYLMYWVSTELFIRAEADRAMTGWADKFRKANPADPADPAVRAAFIQTLDPGKSEAIARNPRLLQTPEMGLPIAQFRNSHLLLISARNPDATLVSHGLRTWDMLPDGRLKCEVAGTLKCAEGEFPVVVPMEGVSTDKGRVWMVQPLLKYLDPDQASRTRYGWLIAALDVRAQQLADQFVATLRTYPLQLGQAAAVAAFLSGRADPAYAENLLRTTLERSVLAGGTALVGERSDPGDAFFARGDGQPMTDAEYDRPDGGKAAGGLTALRRVWADADAANLATAWRSKLTPADMAVRNVLVEVADDRVLFKVPVEFVPRLPEFQNTPGLYAIGRLVFACDDPALLQELNAARAAGGPLSRDVPADLRERVFPYRLLRFESDLVPLSAPRPTQAGGGPPQG